MRLETGICISLTDVCIPADFVQTPATNSSFSSIERTLETERSNFNEADKQKIYYLFSQGFIPNLSKK